VNIDERLERLTERHEALTQGLELLASDVRNLEKRIESLSGYVGEIAEGTARLLHIAQIHEHPITRLEDKDK
jgi:archaellum component FlaC